MNGPGVTGGLGMGWPRACRRDDSQGRSGSRNVDWDGAMLAGAGGRVQGPLRLVTKIIRLDSSWRVGSRWHRAKWRSKSGMDHDTENGVKASKGRFDLLSALFFFPSIGLTQPRRKKRLETANEREWARMPEFRPAWACGPQSRERGWPFNRRSARPPRGGRYAD